MITHKFAATTAMLLFSPLAWAQNASYQTTTEMTGGTLVNVIKSAPFAPAAAKAVVAPTSTITIVNGNRKAVIAKDRTEIYDIDKQTITRLNNEKKTYTVMTFAQMRDALKDMPQKIAEMQAQAKQAQSQGQPATNYTTTFDTQVKNTGATKVVNGLPAQEWIVTLTTKVTMTNPPPDAPMNSMTYVTTTDVWVAPEPAEVVEIRQFDERMYAKIAEGLDMKALMAQMQSAAGGAGMGMMFGNRPGASDAMMQMEKEIAKMKGIRVLEITTMTAPGMPAMPAGSGAGTPPPSGGSVVGQVAGDTASQTASGESS
jgi:hypothetical protein